MSKQERQLPTWIEPELYKRLISLVYKALYMPKDSKIIYFPYSFVNWKKFEYVK